MLDDLVFFVISELEVLGRFGPAIWLFCLMLLHKELATCCEALPPEAFLLSGVEVDTATPPQGVRGIAQRVFEPGRSQPKPNS